MKVSYNPSRNWWSAPKNCTMTTNANIDDLDINGEGDLIFLSKGRVTVPKQMNFRESSKPHLTPTPCPLEWPLSLEIMCMYFILSGPHTYSYATICGAINFESFVSNLKRLQHNFPKMMGGGQRQFGFFSENLSVLVPLPVPVSI